MENEIREVDLEANLRYQRQHLETRIRSTLRMLKVYTESSLKIKYHLGSELQTFFDAATAYVPNTMAPVLHTQAHFNFFPLKELVRLLELTLNRGIKLLNIAIEMFAEINPVLKLKIL